MPEVQSQLPDSSSGSDEELARRKLARRVWPGILSAMSYKLIDRVRNLLDTIAL